MVTDCSLNNSLCCYWEFSLHHLQTLRDPTSPSSSGGDLLAPSSTKVWNMCIFPLFNTKVKICEGMPVCSPHLLPRFRICEHMSLYSLHLLPRFRMYEGMPVCSLYLVLRFRICEDVPACFPRVITAVQ